jgi:phosphoribosylamine--glycine ligase
VVGPEQPLVEGIVDRFQSEGLRVFGPTRAAARLEGSKAFAKAFMERHGIPTARHASFTRENLSGAVRFIEELSGHVVVKADGLAAGKGVIICSDGREALRVVEDMIKGGAFGDAGRHVVVEEFLDGEEASILALTDGERYVCLTPAQDHKRILDGDRGKNTGGMGAYAPAPVVTPDILRRVEKEILVPTLEGMQREGSPYRGCLYMGLMMTAQGPRTLEYNCRFGDPETQVVVPLIDGDLAQILLSIADGRLEPAGVALHKASAVCVVMASGGYPDDYRTGMPIVGLDTVDAGRGEVVFHAGTKKMGDVLVTSGGRVLGVTAIGYENDLEGTIAAAYRIVQRIAFDGAYYRSDIGQKALRHLRKERTPIHQKEN